MHTPCCCSASTMQGTPHMEQCCHAYDLQSAHCSMFADTHQSGLTILLCQHHAVGPYSRPILSLPACCAAPASAAAHSAVLRCHKRTLLPTRCATIAVTGIDRHSPLNLCQSHAVSPAGMLCCHNHDMFSCAEISTVLQGHRHKGLHSRWTGVHELSGTTPGAVCEPKGDMGS